MTDPAPPPDDPRADTGPDAADVTDPATHDLARRRTLRRILGVGAGLGAVVAVLAGVAGATGQAGAAIFLLLSAASCAVAATYGVLTAVRDDLRGLAVSRRRVVWVVGLFFAGAALMAMTAGVGG